MCVCDQLYIHYIMLWLCYAMKRDIYDGPSGLVEMGFIFCNGLPKLSPFQPGFLQTTLHWVLVKGFNLSHQNRRSSYYLLRSLLWQLTINPLTRTQPYGSMYPNKRYIGLKVVPIWVLWGQSIYCLGTWTLGAVQPRGRPCCRIVEAL